MNIPDLVDVVNENALLISELIAEGILLVDTEHQLSTDNALYALAMFYRAAILDLKPRRLRPGSIKVVIANPGVSTYSAHNWAPQRPSCVAFVMRDSKPCPDATTSFSYRLAPADAADYGCVRKDVTH